ncbi:citrate synthase-like protein, partial [Syncephalis pseudoplumigaleata]
MSLKASGQSSSSSSSVGRFTLKDEQSGRTWPLGTPGSNTAHAKDATADQPLTFAVVPGSANTQSLTVLDNRTNKIYEVPIENNTISALKFKEMVASPTPGLSGDKSDQGLRVYDPAFQNTAVARSKITYIDGDEGILRYRGLAAMSTFHPEANPALNGSDMYITNERMRNKQILRLLGKVPTLAAVAYRHRIGRPYNLPRNDLSYTENFLYMMDRLSEEKYRPNPKLARALDILFILHADHELNCSTAAMRHIGSSRVDPYSAIAGASSALYGPLHGGANEAVLRMLEEIGTVDAVPQFLEQVKQRKKKLMGFGHRVYKNYDPRAKIIRQVAHEVFEICGREGLIDVAVELERIALSDEYFIKRRLYPNVDFYSGIIYK